MQPLDDLPKEARDALSKELRAQFGELPELVTDQRRLTFAAYLWTIGGYVRDGGPPRPEHIVIFSK
jgi:hypothetical protein